MKIHQIWLGGELPAREAAWVATVREGAEAAGHEYKLWREAELEEAFGGEAMWAWFTRARACIDNVTTWTLMSDYYGYRILEEEPGCQLDTDFELRGAWPELPTDKVYGISESYNRSKLAYGIFVSAEARPFAMAARLAEAHLLAAADAGSERFEEEYIELVRGDKGRGSGLADAGVGPGWLRRVVLPQWEAAGIAWGFFAPHVVGHAKWPEAPRLAHVGTGVWLHAGRCRDGAYWHALAYRARQAREAAEYERHVATVPESARPRVYALLPEPSPLRAVERAGGAIALPEGTRRVLVLSNVQRGWPGVQTRPGDCVVHLNRAVHRREMGEAAGVTHMLVIRGNGRGYWFAPPELSGFSNVVAATRRQFCSGWAWFAAWRQRTSGSPSTGFMLANALRESYPELPLVLVGFAPDRDCGTYRWDGHDWAAEARWYTERGFKLIPPA